MSGANIVRMTEAEFFAWQARQEDKYELVDGVAVPRWRMMSGATVRHDRIVINALGQLINQLRGKKCRPMTSDVAVRMLKGDIRRPDVTVDCGTPNGDKELTAAEPSFAMEVLSPSTSNFDKFRKLEEYKTVATMRVVALVDSEAPQVTVHRRVAGQWQPETLEGLDKIIDLSEIGAQLALANLFEGIDFDAAGSTAQ